MKQYWKIFVLMILLLVTRVAEAAPARKRIVTYTDFEKSYLYKELQFSKVKTLPGYRIYQDFNNNFVVALQINKGGTITAERIMPIPKVPSKRQNGGLSFFMIDFIFGDKAALTDISTSKELTPYLPKLPEGFKIRGFTVQQVQDPWRIRAGLDVRTSKARPWNLVFAKPKEVIPAQSEPQSSENTAAVESPSPVPTPTMQPSSYSSSQSSYEEPAPKPVEPYKKPSTWSIDGVPQ